MSIFERYQTRYESSREEDMSLQEYLELCKTDPMAYAGAAGCTIWQAAATEGPIKRPASLAAHDGAMLAHDQRHQQQRATDFQAPRLKLERGILHVDL